MLLFGLSTFLVLDSSCVCLQILLVWSGWQKSRTLFWSLLCLWEERGGSYLVQASRQACLLCVCGIVIGSYRTLLCDGYWRRHFLFCWGLRKLWVWGGLLWGFLCIFYRRLCGCLCFCLTPNPLSIILINIYSFLYCKTAGHEITDITSPQTIIYFLIILVLAALVWLWPVRWLGCQIIG